MATKKKLLEAAAGSAGGAALNVEDVFSTYVYTGTSVNPNTITNGIDLAGEGGLVWLKTRTAAFSHTLMDTERGGNKQLYSDTTGAEGTGTAITSFNSDGFTLGTTSILYNSSSYNYASWTFRKAPKFFDVVTYTGNGSTQSISHNLGAVPAFIVIKRTDSTGSWICYHRSLGADKQIFLDLTQAANTNTNTWQNTTPTDGVFYLGNNAYHNALGGTYVAYLFAHNDGDGDFGSTADQDIIKCGSYAGTSAEQEIDLGFEPQWLLIKQTDTSRTDPWYIMDIQRGWYADLNGGSKNLRPNAVDNENTFSTSFNYISPTNKGFKVASGVPFGGGASNTYIYIAIRRGPMAVPESATDVFDIKLDKAAGLPGWISSTGVVDFAIRKYDYTVIGSKYIESRLQGSKAMTTESTAAEVISPKGWDYNTGYTYSTGTTAVADYAAWMWKRAPSFMDVVAYTGTGVARTVSHNLGVAPEMIWVKSRDVARHWRVYHSALGATKTINLNEANAAFTFSEPWNDTEPTDSVITVTGATANVSNEKYIAYLFASLAGISKVGSYTGNGSTQTINCGFSSGARFVLIKRTDSTGDWYVWDAERGIVSANDPHLSLNTTAAQVTTDDSVDPVSSGFAVNQVAATNINVSSASYIFYAIA